FTGKQDDPALSRFRLLPSSLQQLHLFCATDQRHHFGGTQRLEPALHHVLAQNPPCRDGAIEALERAGIYGFTLEHVAGQAARAGGYQHGIGRRCRLQARREVRGLTDDVTLLCRSAPDELSDDYDPRRDADANRLWHLSHGKSFYGL